MTYIAFPKAMRILQEKLKATPEELAGWIWAGPENGGIAAYTNANEFDGPPQICWDIPPIKRRPRRKQNTSEDFALQGYPRLTQMIDDPWESSPPRFFFIHEQGSDYLALLPQCWFSADDIQDFTPGDRFITGKRLRDRWTAQLGQDLDAFVSAKIEESRLMDIHPTMSVTQWSEDDYYPPKESALFVLSHVEAVEEEDGIAPELSDESSIREETPSQRRRRLSIALQKQLDAGEKGALARLAKEEGVTYQTLAPLVNRYGLEAYVSLIDLKAEGDPDPLTHLATKEAIPKLTLAGILKRCGQQLVKALLRDDKDRRHALTSLAEKKSIPVEKMSEIIKHHSENHPTR